MILIKRKMLFVAWPAVTFFCWSPDGKADETRHADETMVVTANRYAQPLDTVLASTTVMTREEIERWQLKSLPEAMQRLPGVDVSQSGGMGHQSSLFIRGSNSSHVLVLINGVRLNQAGVSGSSDLSQIPLSLVQKIEYIRGPRSAIYGSDAIGGVVNIITTREQNGTTLSAEAGSYRYQSYHAATQQQWGEKTVVTLAGDYTNTRGFDVVAAGDTGEVPQPDRDGFRSRSFYGEVQHALATNWDWFMRGYGYANRTRYDGYASSVDEPYNNTRKLYSQTYDTGLTFHNTRYTSQWIVSYGRSKDDNFDGRDGASGSSATRDEIQQYNLQWLNTLALAKGNIGGGVDWQKQTTEPGTGYVTEGREQKNTGIYATGLQHWGDVTLEGAVRSDDNAQFGRHSTWQSSVGWEFLSGYHVIASYGTAYKAPNLGQIYGSFGNLQLQPEESKQWEAGIEGLSGGIDWRVSGYRNHIDNLIDYDSHLNRYQNIGQARIKGIEAILSFETYGLNHHISYDYLDPRDGKTDEILLRRAKQQVKYTLDWQWHDVDWGIAYHYLGQRYDTDFTTYQRVKVGGVSLWDWVVSYPVTSHFTVRGRMANLFDKNYQTAYGYQTAGREFFLTASYIF